MALPEAIVHRQGFSHAFPPLFSGWEPPSPQPSRSTSFRRRGEEGTTTATVLDGKRETGGRWAVGGGGPTHQSDPCGLGHLSYFDVEGEAEGEDAPAGLVVVGEVATHEAS